MTTNTPNQLHARLSQIAMAVKPEGMVSDIICPRVPVEAESFKYTVFAEDTFFNIPDTKIGRKSKANEVEFGGTLVDGSTFDYGLDDFVPRKDIDNAVSQQAGTDPLATATEGTAILVDLAREKRVSTLFQTQANFAAALRQTLSGASQWSDPSSTPLNDIMNAMDLMLVRPNVMVIGRAVATALSRHPQIVAAIYGKTGVGAVGSAAGIVSMPALADLFGLKGVYVGETWFNSAKPGQTPSMARLWGKHATLARIDTSVRNLKAPAMPTFAVTAEWQARRTRTWNVNENGIDGGTMVRVAEQLNELVLWQNAGYLFTNAVA